MDSEAETPSTTLLRLIDGYQVTQAIGVAAELGIADLLSEGPRTSDELASATGSDPDALYRLLRALASLGVFHEAEGRRFALAPIGGCLRDDAPESLRGVALQRMSPSHRQAWSDLSHSVRTGENAFRHVFGMGPWEYRARHPEEQAVFDAAMASYSTRSVETTIRAYDFERFRIIVDVGGGQGALLAGILSRNTELCGILFDQPQVVARARDTLERAGVADRCTVVGGDFFVDIPINGDVYVMRHILHDWEDEAVVAILDTCRRAMAAGTRLLVVERAVGPPNQDWIGKLSDLNMLVNPGGRERTRDEYAALLEQAGFLLTEVIPTAIEDDILEAVAV